MVAFTLEMSNPFPSGFTRDHGGPHSGGHRSDKWYTEFGMDLGAPVGTDVFAAFEAHMTVFQDHDPSSDSGKEYGAKLFMRSLNDKMGGYYTHITDVPAGLTTRTIVRGERLGRVHSFNGIPTHLHFALVEIVGGFPGGTYMGVDSLFSHFVSTANTSTVHNVTFSQNSKQPTV